MSTLRTTHIQHPSSPEPNITLSADGSVAGVNIYFDVTVKGSDGEDSDWTGGDPVVATITVPGLKSTDRPIVDINLSEVNFEDLDDTEQEWAYVYRAEASDDDELKLYAKTEPESDFQIMVKVGR
jgi:hypothetical protein